MSTIQMFFLRADDGDGIKGDQDRGFSILQSDEGEVKVEQLHQSSSHISAFYSFISNMNAI